MRIYPVFITLLLLPCMLYCQTNISGVVNKYYKVVEVIPASSCVRVDNTSGLGTNDMVMIIQMKGATVSTSNNSSFGSVTSMNNAGNYEINNICSVHGDSVFLYKQLLRAYTVSMKVQLVRIPQYASAQVTDSLKAAAWDNTTGKGGVLAISVSDNLVLSAPVFANGTGYRGGTYATSNSDCSNFLAANNFSYDATLLSPQNGAWKGESIADPATSNTGGKGAFASGGGGGNNHNNGGGGGANIAAGGAGGGNTSTSGCTTANPGIGGYALANNTGTRIFLGGGGGAGHANSGFPALGGGAGGGIVFIKANVLYSNGQPVTANGADGGSTLGDGASGGGAGGSIIFDVNTYADALTAQAKGGKGGDENDDFTSGKCYGEGGGGSGGILFFKTASPGGALSVAGGLKGNKINSLSCGAAIPSVAGNTGTISTNYSYMQSTTLSSCTSALPLALVSFQGRLMNDGVHLDWAVTQQAGIGQFIVERNDLNSWKEIGTVAAQPALQSYHFLDPDPPGGLTWYRLKLEKQTGEQEYSLSVMIKKQEELQLQVFPNPSSGMVSVIHAFKPGSRLFIYDGLGQPVLERTIRMASPFVRLDVSMLKKAVYLVVTDGQSASLVVDR